MKTQQSTPDRDPDLQLGNVCLWVHGREFPEAQDCWDGNVLCVTARCDTARSSVEVTGAVVRVEEIDAFLRQIEDLYQTLQGQAELACLEPNLGIALKALTGGHIRMETEITPDHMTESHWFLDELDQTYLPPVITQCRAILELFPVRGRA